MGSINLTLYLFSPNLVASVDNVGKFLSKRGVNMKIGDKIKFDFAGKKKEGTVSKLFDNTVYLKVDFNKDKQKTVKRKLSQVDSKKSKKK